MRCCRRASRSTEVRNLAQACEHKPGPAGIDARPGLFHSMSEAGSNTGDEQGRGGVQQRDVGVRTCLAPEDGLGDVGRLVERADRESVVRGVRDAKVGWADVLTANRALVDVDERRLGAGGQFIKPVHAVGHDGAMSAERRKTPGHGLGQGVVVHADELAARARRIRERAEQVENGAEAERLARPGGVTHGGVVMDRKAEADAGSAKALGLHLGRGVDVDAEAFEHLSRAATGAAAIAVLGDEDGGLIRGSGGSDGDDRGNRGNIEHLGRPARAAGVDEHLTSARVNGDAGDVPTHRGGGADEFVGHRPAGLDQRQQCPYLSVIESAREKALEERLGLRGREWTPGDKLRKRCMGIHGAERTPIGKPAPIE